MNGALVPPAALIGLVQKAMQFTEAQICAEGGDEERQIEPLSLIDAVMPRAAPARQGNGLGQPTLNQAGNQNSANNSSSGNANIIAKEEDPSEGVSSGGGGGGGGGPPILDIKKEEPVASNGLPSASMEVDQTPTTGPQGQGSFSASLKLNILK